MGDAEDLNKLVGRRVAKVASGNMLCMFWPGLHLSRHCRKCFRLCVKRADDCNLHSLPGLIRCQALTCTPFAASQAFQDYDGLFYVSATFNEVAYRGHMLHDAICMASCMPWAKVSGAWPMHASCHAVQSLA